MPHVDDARIEEEIEAGLRCVRCHELFAEGDERTVGGGIHPVTGQRQTRAVHNPATCEHHPVP